MFSSNISGISSCRTYVGAVHIHTNAEVPRNKTNWPEGTRPLTHTRQTHYAVRREHNTIFFRLYKTDVVVWHGPTTVTLDSSYDNTATRQFADRFLPSEIDIVPFREEGHVVSLGYRDQTPQLFLRGVHTFERDGLVWEVVSPTIKPKHKVVNPNVAKELNKEMAPFIEWVKGIWAISGNDGHHPWVGQPHTGSMSRTGVFAYLVSDDPCAWDAAVCKFLPTGWSPVGMCYKPIRVDALLAAIRKRVYEDEDAYIKVDYDQSAPKLMK